MYIECIILWIPYMYMYLAPFPYNVYRMQYTMDSLHVPGPIPIQYVECSILRIPYLAPFPYNVYKMQYTRDSLHGPILIFLILPYSEEERKRIHVQVHGCVIFPILLNQHYSYQVLCYILPRIIFSNIVL